MRRTPRTIHSMLLIAAASAALLSLPLHGAEAGGTAPVLPAGALKSWIPADVVGYLEVRDLGRRLRSALGSEEMSRLRGSAAGRELESRPEMAEFRERLKWFRQLTGVQPLDLVDTLLGREAVVAVRLDFGGPDILFAARCAGEDGVETVRKALRALAEEVLGFWPLVEVGRHRGHRIDGMDNFHITSIGSVLVAGTRSSTLEQVIDLAHGKGGESIASTAAFARGAAWPKERLASVVVRPQFLPDYEIPARVDNFGASLLVSGVLGALEASELLSVSLDVEETGVSIEVASALRAGGLGRKHAGFFPEAPVSPLARRLESKGLLAVARLRRDVEACWKQGEALLHPWALEERDRLSQVLSFVFAGRSFETEILPALGPTMLVVVAQQSYEALGRAPAPAIPGFATVLELEDADRFGQNLNGMLQTLAGLYNANQAQRSGGGSIVVVETRSVAGVPLHCVTRAAPSDSGESTPGIEHNFTPSVAVVGDQVIVSSCEELARMLVSEAKRASGATVTASREAADRVVLAARGLEGVLRANREAIVADNMRKKGVDRQTAEGGLAAALELIELLDRVELESGMDSGVYRLRLRVQRRGPAASSVDG